MASAVTSFTFSKSVTKALTGKLWIIVLVGLGGAVAGYFQGAKFPLFSTRTIIEIGYHHTPKGIGRSMTAKELSGKIQQDIDQLVDSGIYGKSFVKYVEAVASERQFVMISLNGNDPALLQSSMEKIATQHVTALQQKEEEIRTQAGREKAKKKKTKHKFKVAKTKHMFSETYEIVHPFNNIISSQASRIVLPALYAAFAASFAFIGFLLFDRRKTAS